MSLQNDEEIPEKEVTAEEFLATQKSAIRKKSWWGIGIGAFLVLAHLALFSIVIFSNRLEDVLTWKDLFKSIFFILGLFALAGGIYGLRYAKNLTIEDYIASPEAIEFARQASLSKPIYTYILVASIVCVTLAQFSIGLQKSISLAGFYKPVFLQNGEQNGEWWRILTSGALHGGFLHIYFNGQALYGFGGLIEFLSNRAHLTIVFLLSIIGGGLLSLALMPDALIPTVGASGGIMGLIGYLAIYGYRRKRQLPPDFLKSMLVNIGFIAAFGVIAWQIVDNFAHLGGLSVGAVYGFLQIPRNFEKNPRDISFFTELVGAIALGIFIATCIFSISLFLKT